MKHSFFYRLSVNMAVEQISSLLNWSSWTYDAHVERALKLKEWTLDTCKDLGINMESCALWQGINPHTDKVCFFFKLYDTLFVVDRPTITALRWLVLNFDESEQAEADELKAKERRKINSRVRFEILARDQYTCQLCGHSPDKHGVALQVDHIVPIDKGGRTHEGNLLTLCESCNQAKGAGMYPQLIRPECFNPPIEAYPRSNVPENREWLKTRVQPATRWGSPIKKVRVKHKGIRRIALLVLSEAIQFIGRIIPLLYDVED